MRPIVFLYKIKRLLIIIVLVFLFYALQFTLLPKKIHKISTNISNKRVEYTICGDRICDDCICGFGSLIGRTEVFSLETPLNDSMRKLTPSFNDLRERFNNSTRNRFWRNCLLKQTCSSEIKKNT